MEFVEVRIGLWFDLTDDRISAAWPCVQRAVDNLLASLQVHDGVYRSGHPNYRITGNDVLVRAIGDHPSGLPLQI
jgi:hypothetical protein